MIGAESVETPAEAIMNHIKKFLAGLIQNLADQSGLHPTSMVSTASLPHSAPLFPGAIPIPFYWLSETEFVNTAFSKMRDFLVRKIARLAVPSSLLSPSQPDE